MLDPRLELAFVPEKHPKTSPLHTLCACELGHIVENGALPGIKSSGIETTRSHAEHMIMLGKFTYEEAAAAGAATSQVGSLLNANTAA